MPTELLTLNQVRAEQADRPSPLKDLPSQQKATVRVDDTSFSDVLQALNPLNHIPVLSSLQTAASPDLEDNALMPTAKMISGGLLGGVFGLIGAAADNVFQQSHGKGFFQTLISVVTRDDSANGINEGYGTYQKVSDLSTENDSHVGRALSIES